MTVITSPNYPGDYPVLAECSWSIRSSSENKTVLSISEQHTTHKVMSNHPLVSRSAPSSRLLVVLASLALAPNCSASLTISAPDTTK